MKPDEIEMVRTGSGEWISEAEHARRPKLPDVGQSRPDVKPSAVDDIPRLGSPVEFFTLIGCLVLISYLF